MDERKSPTYNHKNANLLISTYLRFYIMQFAGSLSTVNEKKSNFSVENKSYDFIMSSVHIIDFFFIKPQKYFAISTFLHLTPNI